MHLARLRIENLALVDALDAAFEPGMIAVTGETGAGKSMILGSLELLLGARADAGLVRKGAARAVVEAVFEPCGGADRRARALRAELEAIGIALEGDDPLILRREIAESGRSIAQVAGRLVTVRQLAAITAHLIDIHSQHDQQSLTQRRWQRDALDAFAGALDLADTVREAHQAWRAVQAEHDDWQARDRELRRQEDLLRFQLDDIRKAQVEPGEDGRLAQRETILANAEELRTETTAVRSLLGDDDNGAASCLRTAQRELQRLAHLDPATATWSDTLAEALIHVDDVERQCGSYLERIEVNPGELEQVQDRLHLLTQLKKKYGGTIEEILSYAAKAEEDLRQIGGYDDRLTALAAKADALNAVLRGHAQKLSTKRKTAAAKLRAQVEKELAQLGMARTTFVASLEPAAEIGPAGAEEVEFLIAANPGEDPKPLNKVASGGELSRITLALKCIATRTDDMPVLVFDEIDAGVGGTVAHAVGERLQSLGVTHQVFVITHLPQIACRASTHLSVNKTVSGTRTTVSLEGLGDEGLERELARMLGGDSKAALAHARELVKNGRESSKSETRNPKQTGKTRSET